MGGAKIYIYLNVDGEVTDTGFISSLDAAHTQIDDVRSRDAADARGRGAHPHAGVPDDGGVQLGGVDVDDAEGHGEAKLSGHFQRQSNVLKG